MLRANAGRTATYFERSHVVFSCWNWDIGGDGDGDGGAVWTWMPTSISLYSCAPKIRAHAWCFESIKLSINGGLIVFYWSLPFEIKFPLEIWAVPSVFWGFDGSFCGYLEKTPCPNFLETGNITIRGWLSQKEKQCIDICNMYDMYIYIYTFIFIFYFHIQTY